MCVYEKTKINEKESGVGPFFKKSASNNGECCSLPPGHATRLKQVLLMLLFNDGEAIIRAANFFFSSTVRLSDNLP